VAFDQLANYHNLVVAVGEGTAAQKKQQQLHRRSMPVMGAEGMAQDNIHMDSPVGSAGN
jgi:hypothetical protein